MDDRQIVELFLQRSEGAIREAERSHGKTLLRLARNVLRDGEDARECVNDTLLAAWNSIPPQEPADLGSYLCRIARQTAIDRYRARNRDKRRPSQYAASLEELSDVVGGEDAADAADAHALAEAIGAWLRTRPQRERRTFVARYYYAESLRDIARREGMTQSAAKSLLHRVRQGLRQYLEKEGFTL